MTFNFRNIITLIFALSLTACSYLPEGDSIDSYKNVRSENGDYLFLAGGDDMPEHILLFVPGGLVDPHVYLCWMDRLIDIKPDIGILSLKVPSNLPILNQQKVLNVMDDFPDSTHWVIGGHSLGGVVAASVISKNPDAFEALILLASFTTDYADISSWKGSVLSVYGSNDGLTEESDVEANMKYLPSGISAGTLTDIEVSEGTTTYYRIDGGNHSGFGCYGLQKDDNEATVTQQEQQDELILVLSEFMTELWK